MIICMCLFDRYESLLKRALSGPVPCAVSKKRGDDPSRNSTGGIPGSAHRRVWPWGILRRGATGKKGAKKRDDLLGREISHTSETSDFFL